MDSLKTIKKLGLDERNFETMHTNCDGVYLFDYITLKRFDCTSYHKGYAHGLRTKIPTLTQLKTDCVEDSEPFVLTREQTLTVLNEYKSILFYMAEHQIGSDMLTDDIVKHIMQLAPFSTQIYGEKDSRIFIERFTFLVDYAKFFDIDLEKIE